MSTTKLLLVLFLLVFSKSFTLLLLEVSLCVPGRFIGENVAFIRDVVDYCSLSSTPLISLDQEKAVDRVDWSFLRSVLISMGFGPSLLNGWICFIVIPVVQLMLMVILVILFPCLVVSGRVAPCLRYFTS